MDQTQTPSLRVDQVLARSRARVERQCTLPDGLSLMQWSTSDDETAYVKPGHHTLSIYLDGGSQTRLLDGPGGTGAPGCHCLLPAEHESRWATGQLLRVLHLYWSGADWADRVVRLLDAEPRSHSLDPRFFARDPALAHWAQRVRLCDWDDPVQRFALLTGCQAVLDQLLLQSARPAQRDAVLRPRGGLSGRARRRVLDYIDAQLAGPSKGLSLAALAREATLSEFYFARMFRVSMGCTVQAWVARRRRERTLDLLRNSQLSLSEVASAAGYNSASHLSHSVRRDWQLTPRQLRRQLIR